MFAAALIGSASASASAFVIDSAPVDIEGTASAAQFKYANQATTCSAGTDLYETLGSSTETLSMGYAPNCAPPLNANGCEFIFKPGAVHTPGEAYYDGTAEIGPPGCGPMITSAGGHPAYFYPTTGMQATFQNQGSGKSATVKVTVQTSKLKWQWPFSSPQIHENGSFSGSWTLAAVKPQSSFQVEPGVPTALETAKSGEAQVFKAGSYPASVQSTSRYASKATWSFLKSVECSSAQYRQGALAAASSTLTLSAAYSGCKLGLFPTKVEMNGCTYALSLTKENGGTDGISCPGGKAIELLAYANQSQMEENKVLCKFAIGSGSGSLTTTNVGAEGMLPARIGTSVSFSNLKYTLTRYSASCPGTGSGGTFEGGFSQEAALQGFL